MVFTTLKAKHLSTFWYQITETNMSNKEEYVEHLEPTIEDIDEEKNLHPSANPDTHTTNSLTTKKLISEQVEPQTQTRI